MNSPSPVFVKIPPPIVEVYGPDGKLVAKMNEYEWMAFRFEIKTKKAEGYYVMFQGVRININADGQPEKWPKGFFDLFDNLIEKLVEWEVKKF